MNSGSFSAGSNIKSEASGNIRMDVILSADKSLQLYSYSSLYLIHISQ